MAQTLNPNQTKVQVPPETIIKTLSFPARQKLAADLNAARLEEIEKEIAKTFGPSPEVKPS